MRAGGSKYDIVAPTGYAVKTMADLGLIMPLTHELIPNIKNIQPAFTKTVYDPGNKYSVPKDYGITSFYWLTEKCAAYMARSRSILSLTAFSRRVCQTLHCRIRANLWQSLTVSS